MSSIKFQHDIDFENLKAISMVCDNGATLPTSGITTGQWFLHTPTGRNILYMYDGSNWISIISLGTMTVYVDKTDGTDASDKGTAVDSDAFATIQYAINAIPGLVGGNVVININNETYSEDIDIRGKALTGSFTITLQGTLNSQVTESGATVAQGSTSTMGTVTAASGTPFGSGDNMLVYFDIDGVYRLIHSDTTTVLTLVGYAPSSTAQDVVVYDWGTTITPSSTGIFCSGQQGLVFNDIKITGSTYSWWLQNFCEVVFNRVWSDGRFLMAKGTVASIWHSLSAGSPLFGFWCDSAIGTFLGCKISGSPTYGLFSSTNGVISWVFEAMIDGATTGVYSSTGSIVDCQNDYSTIANATTGMLADHTAKIIRTTNHTFTSVSTNKSPAAASDPSYIA